jgi:hypothetical protein
MFETDTAGSRPILPPSASGRRPKSKGCILKWGVLLTSLGCATLLVWGFVLKVQDTADRIN